MPAFPSALSSYLAASVMYSLATALVVEALLRIWGVQQPHSRFRFRVLVLFLPLLLWSAYALFYPAREGDLFRHGRALLDTRQWLEMMVTGIPAVWYAFLLVLAVTTILFLVQEIVPSAAPMLPGSRDKTAPGLGATEAHKLQHALNDASHSLGHSAPPVAVLESEAPSVHVGGLFHPRLFVSSGLVQRLDADELRGVIAHELAHLKRRDSWWGWALLLMRTLMFFNPVALLAYRQLTQDNEMACDDLAIAATGQPMAFSSGLLKVFRAAAPGTRTGDRDTSPWLHKHFTAIYDHADMATVKKRVSRLLRPHASPSPSMERLRLIITVVALSILLFFVV